MKSRTHALVSYLSCFACLTCPVLSQAAEPFVTIQEVVTGMPGHPNVQYVVLHVFVGGDFRGWRLDTYDNANIPAGTNVTYLTGGDLAHIADNSTYLLATEEAEDYFHLGADSILAGLNTEGVIVLRDATTVHKHQASLPYGTSVDPVEDGYTTTYPFNYAGGILPGQVAQRLAYTSTDTVDNAARDFHFVSQPWPQNSIGQVGYVTPGVCGNGTVDGLEQCDDGASNGTAGAPCTAACLWVPGGSGSVCGNGRPEASEQCDDGNLVNTDGCSSTCQWESPLSPAPRACGNGVLETNEDCDPPHGTHCDPNCKLTGAASCGDASVEAGEQCDSGATNGSDGDPCDANCFWGPAHPVATCGNGVAETGEQCDAGVNNDPPGTDFSDPNVYHSGCSQACQVETLKYWRCGDGLLNPGEACDHGDANNGLEHDTCRADCQWRVVPQAQTGDGSAGSTGGGTTGAGGETSTGGTAPAGAVNSGAAPGNTVHPLGCASVEGSLYAGLAAALVASRSRKNTSSRVNASRLAARS